MEPMEYIMLASAAIELVQKLQPIIDQAVKNGEVSVEAQQSYRSKCDALQADLDQRMAAPHWQVDPS